MSTIEKLIKRLLNNPKDLSFDEAKRLLEHFGYRVFNKGKTSGSRVCFMKENKRLDLHKPHPSGILKPYQVRRLINFLKEDNEI